MCLDWPRSLWVPHRLPALPCWVPVAGNLKGPDVRAVIKTDLDLLDRIPEDQVQRRAAMSQMIAARIDDLPGLTLGHLWPDRGYLLADHAHVQHASDALAWVQNLPALDQQIEHLAPPVNRFPDVHIQTICPLG